jgi:succinyl-diaminopimelate desuccinylase
VSFDPIALTQELVRLDTRNPPGREQHCAEYLAPLLADCGFAVDISSFGPGRTNLVARIGEGPALMFTGHLDTVPLGAAPWTQDPFGGNIVAGRLYGRGACDMKAGVAAMLVAAAAEAGSGRAVTLVFTGGEETGAHGARALAAERLLGEARLLVVGEPTANRFISGHKGALWLEACCSGVTAHGSTPHLGENAVYKAARGVVALEGFGFNVAPHPIMGSPTLNVGTIAGGANINSVPDRATFTVDIRTVPGMDHARVGEAIGVTVAPGTEVTALVDLPSVWSDPEGPGMRRLAEAYVAATGRPAPVSSANYFTDASVLTPALGNVPTLICGPGDPAMAHKTDEYCEVAMIEEAVAIYREIIRSA